jgi:hypothetical protein
MLFYLVWFVFLVWGCWLHYIEYKKTLLKLNNESIQMNEALEFSILINALFNIRDKQGILQFLDENKQKLQSYIDSVFDKCTPEISIFSSHYINVLMYRTQCYDIVTDIDKKINKWSREAHMYFMLMTMDLRLHGRVSNKAYIRKFVKVFKLFVHMSDFKLFTSAVNKMGMLLRELKNSMDTSDNDDERDRLSALYDQCTSDLLVLVGSEEVQEVIKKLLAGEVYTPMMPSALGVESITSSQNSV